MIGGGCSRIWVETYIKRLCRYVSGIDVSSFNIKFGSMSDVSCCG
jgi:hypothetical protein